jgi:hypothetical protein
VHALTKGILKILLEWKFPIVECVANVIPSGQKKLINFDFHVIWGLQTFQLFI